ncbi:MAG: fibro-slime domain-containing protein [Phycisphaerales bacterium JB040]
MHAFTPKAFQPRQLAIIAGAAFLGTAGVLSFTGGTTPIQAGAAETADPWADLPDTFVLSGTLRDFKEWDEPGGHPDFEPTPADGFGLYVNMVADKLGPDRKPVFRSHGNRVTSQAKDAKGRSIIGPKPYLESRSGDIGRVVQGVEQSISGDAPIAITDFDGDMPRGAVFSKNSFDMWYRDVPGVNFSEAYSITLHRQAGTNLYVFDDKLDPKTQALGGFFVMNGKGYGNSRGETKNFHFTYHLSTEFLYKKGFGQEFRFIGDDDVWVFINGELVIDLGGIHGATEQVIEMDRMTSLEHGKIYTLDFFFAERHRTQSNFRIETNLVLKRPVTMPSGNGLYD